MLVGRQTAYVPKNSYIISFSFIMLQRGHGQLRIAQVLPYGVHPCSGLVPIILQLSLALSRRGNWVEVWNNRD